MVIPFDWLVALAVDKDAKMICDQVAGTGVSTICRCVRSRASVINYYRIKGCIVATGWACWKYQLESTDKYIFGVGVCVCGVFAGRARVWRSAVHACVRQRQGDWGGKCAHNVFRNARARQYNIHPVYHAILWPRRRCRCRSDGSEFALCGTDQLEWHGGRHKTDGFICYRRLWCETEIYLVWCFTRCQFNRENEIIVGQIGLKDNGFGCEWMCPSVPLHGRQVLLLVYHSEKLKRSCDSVRKCISACMRALLFSIKSSKQCLGCLGPQKYHLC